MVICSHCHPTMFCFIKIQNGFAGAILPGSSGSSLDKKPLNRCSTYLCTTVQLPLILSTHISHFVCIGYLNFAKLNRMGETNRLMGHGVFDYMEGFHSNMFGRHWRFTLPLYSRAAVDLPMTMRTWLGGFGRTSIDLCQTIRQSSTGDLLASGVFRVVNVDPNTQRAVALPDRLREKLSAETVKVVGAGERFSAIRPPSAVPDGSFSCKVTVRHDDMDFLFHTTQGAYLGFARECAAQASESGFYSRLCDDIAFHLASETTGVHFAESFAGDELTVSTWEDAVCPLLLHFTVSRHDRVIYYATIRYFADN